MRLIAIIPLIFSVVALILTFLCVFAGSSTGFMEDYAIITLNTTEFGAGVVNLTQSNGDNSNPLQNLVNQITDLISNEINEGINYVARDLGLKDWYSLHALTFCEGYYAPGPQANATVDAGSIYKNVTRCSNRTALFEWNPKAELQRSLNENGYGWLNVTALRWPDGIDANVENLQTTFKATFVLYVIAIVFMFLAFGAAIAAIFLLGRLFTTLNIIVDTIAFLSILIASALVTVVMQQGSKNISNYGSNAGIVAYGSSKLLAITWVATALMFVASLIWCITCCTGRRSEKTQTSRRSWRRSRRGPHDNVAMHNVKAHEGT